MIEFRLPDVGEGLEEAEVMRWLVAPGDRVTRDQPIVEIQTDKALVEIPSPAAGTMTRLGAEVGAIVKVGELLFVLDAEQDGNGEAPAGKRDAAATREPGPRGVLSVHEGGRSESREVSARDRASRGASAATGPHRLRPRAAPTVRKLAAELGVDLRTIDGSGPAGRVLADDVRRAAGTAAGTVEDIATRREQGAAGARSGAVRSAAPPTPGSSALPTTAIPRELGQAQPGSRMPIAGIRRVIVQTMTQSWTTIPHIHGHDELDAQPLVDAVRGLRRRAASRASSDGTLDASAQLTMSVFFVLAAARALRRFPLVNASIDLDAHHIVVHEQVNVGLAVATPAGLIVPVVRDADRRSLRELAAEIDRLARAARERKVKPDELRGGTFTVTNFGSLGGRFANPIIRPPEVGILGFGAIRERPWALGGGRIEARPVLPISFGADHRVIDGDLSVAFQEFVRDLLSDPIHLFLGE